MQHGRPCALTAGPAPAAFLNHANHAPTIKETPCIEIAIGPRFPLFSPEGNEVSDTFTATGLDDVVTLLEGDALQTLAALRQPVDFLFLDGWKDLCLPVLRLLEPHIAPGALVVADDVDLPALAPYLDHVRDTGNGYHSVTFPVEDGLEISCRL
ncbi:O-methyltransferase [Streptomyces anulatus]